MREPDARHKKRAAEIVLPCDDLDATVLFFTDKLGFRIDAVFPADDPSVAEISGHGVHVRLEQGGKGAPGVLRLFLETADPSGAMELTAPNGTRIQLARPEQPLELPPLRPSFVLTRREDSPDWHTGRAGMQYRDLIPDRQGGRFIASHIRIPDGGPVRDYVHFHEIRFQMIFCLKGWVRVVYEDQGPPFVLRAGDCVLQPPRIRHRVLESSEGLEVIEVTSPAEHETRVDHDLFLPTSHVYANRDFGGQSFLHHVASEGRWSDWRHEGFEACDMGMAAATRGLAASCVVRARGDGVSSAVASHDGEFLFLCVIQGGCRLRSDGRVDQRMGPGEATVVPAGMPYALKECSRDLELLEVCLPATTR